MDLLVVGAGPVGRALARGWSAAGHVVAVAVRHPTDPKHNPYRAEHTLVGAADLPPADATVLAVPGDQLPVLLDANASTLDGRLLLDATNTLGQPHLHQLSLLTKRLSTARIYRAFTTTGWENFRSDVAGERPDLLYCGPDGNDRAAVEQLITDMGPRPLWLGAGPRAADLLDAMARLWFALALQRGLGRNLAVRLLTGPPDDNRAPADEAVPGDTTPRRPTPPTAVTIVGRGHIATALGTAWARAGHSVTLAVREPVSPGELTPDGIAISDIVTALRASDTIVLALPGSAVATFLQTHRDNLSGRLIIDAANVTGDNPADSAAPAATIPHARYARAFNSLGVENLRNPRFTDGPADMMFTAPHADRPLVAELITAVGLRPVWLPPGNEHIIDDLLPLWFTLARTHGRHLAFRVLTTNPEL